MARPTKLPDWGGLTNLTEPSLAKRALGWIFGEAPPSSFANWFWNLITLWVIHLDERDRVTFDIDVSPSVWPTTTAAPGFISNNWQVGTGTAKTTGDYGFQTGAADTSLCECVRNDIGEVLTGYAVDPSEKLTLTEIEYYADLQTIGTCSIVITLWQSPRDGSGGGTSIASVTDTTQTTGIERRTLALAHDFDPTLHYYLTVTVRDTGGAQDCILYGLSLVVVKALV